VRNGQAFVGFREAAIDFPPTFKYDVLRTIRHKRKRSKNAQAIAGAVAPLLQEPPEGVINPEPEGHHDGGHSEVSSDDDTNAELASVISSGTTTFSQRDQESDDDNDSDAESDYLRRRMSYPQRSGGLVKRISISAAQRAKSKLAELINAPSSPRPKRSRRANAPTLNQEQQQESSEYPNDTASWAACNITIVDDPSDGVLASVSSFKARVQPSPSFVGDGTAETEDDRGVYDSSSKQRVPSWCDRILFKSTVKPDPETEDDSHAASQRTAMSLIAQAWRSFRRTSSTSLRSVSTTTVASSTSAASFNSFPSPHSGDSESDVGRFLPTPYVPRRKRPRPRSVDVVTLGTSSQPTPLTTSRPGTSTGIQMHHVSGAKSGASPKAPARTQTAPSALAVGPNQQYHEPSLMEGTPVSSLTSSMTTSSSAASSGSPVSVTAAPGGGSGRNHPRWRLLSFLSRDAEAARAAAEASGSATTTDADADAESAARMATTTATSPSPGSGAGLDGAGAWAAPAESPRHRKGDVVCLSYRTLDDRGMRRLEGRSDHRPVIGAYGIYV
jgi:hypothetical protein